MAMTNYMELLMANQPWNLILFMAVPMGLAEAIVASEFFSLYRAQKGSLAIKINKCLSIILGAYFTILIIYVAVKILPAIHLRGAADTLALAAYVAAALPALVLLLLELGVIAKGAEFRARLKFHFLALIVFLVLGHVAMIFGMTDPGMSGMEHSMMDHGSMSGMSHDMGSMEGMDHSHMNHGSMENMDHGGMDHSKMEHSH